VNAVGRHPLRRPEPQVVVDQRPRLRRAQVIEPRAVLARDVEDVGKARRGDQRRSRASLLQQGIGSHGHPVGEDLNILGRGSGAVQRRVHRRQHPLRLVVGRRGRLGRVQRAPVVEHGVGERPADVYAQQHEPDASDYVLPGPATGPSPPRREAEDLGGAVAGKRDGPGS
jgi:hypothetical protein